MKKYILIAFATLSVVACGKKSDNTEIIAEVKSAPTTNLTQAKVEIPVENIETAEFKIEGMTCQMGCANTIKGKLEALTGVANADVSFDKGNAIVTFDKTALKVQDLKNTVNSIADGKLYKVIE